MKNYSTVNFGTIAGDREVAHLNLLETISVRDVLGVGSTQSLFGTAPDFWNALLGFMAKLPPDLLANEGIMRKLSIFSIPICACGGFLCRCHQHHAVRRDLPHSGTRLMRHGNLRARKFGTVRRRMRRRLCLRRAPQWWCCGDTGDLVARRSRWRGRGCRRCLGACECGSAHERGVLVGPSQTESRASLG